MFLIILDSIKPFNLLFLCNSKTCNVIKKKDHLLYKSIFFKEINIFPKSKMLLRYNDNLFLIVWTISWFSLGIYSFILKTEDVIFEVGDTIILNCTYDNDIQEKISDRDIRWQKQISDYFEDIALFSPPVGILPFIAKEMQPLYSNRTELIAPNISLSAVFIIKYPVCSDQGVYRCWIKYYSAITEKVQTSDSVVNFKCNYFFLINPKQVL